MILRAAKVQARATDVSVAYKQTNTISVLLSVVHGVMISNPFAAADLRSHGSFRQPATVHPA